jgi:hypothetical protein
MRRHLALDGQQGARPGLDLEHRSSTDRTHSLPLSAARCYLNRRRRVRPQPFDQPVTPGPNRGCDQFVSAGSRVCEEWQGTPDQASIRAVLGGSASRAGSQRGPDSSTRQEMTRQPWN